MDSRLNFDTALHKAPQIGGPAAAGMKRRRNRRIIAFKGFRVRPPFIFVAPSDRRNRLDQIFVRLLRGVL
jgi:hypothetical protein